MSYDVALARIAQLQSLFVTPAAAAPPVTSTPSTAASTSFSTALQNAGTATLTPTTAAQPAASSAGQAIVNLASTEYWSALDGRHLKAPVIQAVFKEIRAGKAQVISFLAKKARGLMARPRVLMLDEPSLGLADVVS